VHAIDGQIFNKWQIYCPGCGDGIVDCKLRPLFVAKCFGTVTGFATIDHINNMIINYPVIGPIRRWF